MSEPTDRSTIYEELAEGKTHVWPIYSRYIAGIEPFTGRKTFSEDRFFRPPENSTFTRWFTDDGVELHNPRDFTTGTYPDRPRVYKGKDLTQMTHEELLVAAEELYDNGYDTNNLYNERFELIPVPMPPHYPMLLKNP